MSITDRAVLLIDLAGLDAFAPVRSKEYYRWSNIKRGKARLGAEEIERLNAMFPRYRWWLVTGEVMPESGQTSPAYDEANRNLSQPSAG
ncbi:DNA-binding protein [Stutzerimonas stutzeri]|nr:DNA-binding protein [Stutzerimonas stutzeri]